MLSWVSRPCGTCAWGWGWGRHHTSLGAHQEPAAAWSPRKVPCGEGCSGLLHPGSVPSLQGGRKSSSEHGCCGAEGGVGSVSVEAVSGGF